MNIRMCIAALLLGPLVSTIFPLTPLLLLLTLTALVILYLQLASPVVLATVYALALPLGHFALFLFSVLLNYCIAKVEISWMKFLSLQGLALLMLLPYWVPRLWHSPVITPFNLTFIYSRRCHWKALAMSHPRSKTLENQESNTSTWRK